MSARIIARTIDGRAVAAKVRSEVAVRAAALRARGVVPGLAVVLVGEDPASQVYVRSKARAAREAGVAAFDHTLPQAATQAELLDLVGQLNADPAVDGILVQMPLPSQIDPRAVIEAIDPDKDVDGFHATNVGRLWSAQPRFVPCTPLGIMRLLAEAGVPLRGKDAVIVGRSNLVGRPIAGLLLMADATPTVCHSRTKDLAGHVGRADVVVAAIGQPEMIKGAWIKEGAVVIDVGINRIADKKIVGDVEFAAAAERASAITPVPGGVGPMTIAMLLSNTVDSASRRAK